jgi:AraC family transcriptional regulator, regulatory protein of adaptative response / DNA-3-methyladenine glycosylase II
VIPGVEVVDGTTYRRSFVAAGLPGWLSIAPIEGEPALALRVHHAKPSALGEIVARVRRMFDVDADPLALNAHLRRDPLLKPLVKRWPGQRLPNAWDGFELAVRAILGQQVSVAAARTLASRIAAKHGTPYAEGEAVGLGALFPEPEVIADAPLEAIGVMRARADAIRTLARAVADGRVHFRAEQTLATFEQSLVALPGIGPWTAHYIAMRALGWPDAFPPGDVAALKAMRQLFSTASPRDASAHAERWRPWRAYALLRLWNSLGVTP